MGSPDAIPGWHADAVMGSSGADRPRIPDRLSGVWQTYRARRRDIVRLAVTFHGSLGLVFVPLAVIAMTRLGNLSGVVTLPRPASSDLEDMIASLFPTMDPLTAVGTALAPTLTFLAFMTLTVSIAALLLSAHAEDRTADGAIRAVARRAAAIAGAVGIVAVVACAIVAVESLWIGALGAPPTVGIGGFDRMGRIVGLVLLANLVGAVAIGLAANYAVRWAVAVPAMAVEGIGLRAALRRSSELTRNRRLAVAFALFVVIVLTGLASSGVLYVTTLMLGSVISLASAPGLVLSSALTLIAFVLIAPILPLTLVLMYRDLSAVAANAVAASAEAPPPAQVALPAETPPAG